jgi:hypothetical protein
VVAILIDGVNSEELDDGERSAVTGGPEQAGEYDVYLARRPRVVAVMCRAYRPRHAYAWRLSARGGVDATGGRGW